MKDIQETIVSINSVNFSSTGNIMLQIAEEARHNGYKVYTSCANSKSNRRKSIANQILIGTRLGRNFHAKVAEITGLNGSFSFLETWKFLRRIEKLNPSLIHLHNLHNCYINLPLLFRFIKKKAIPTVWTLHDCWAFTGHCPYFSYIRCEKWKTECFECPQYMNYPKSVFDNSRSMFYKKRNWFTRIQNLVLASPSQWLKALAKDSFLSQYTIFTVNNGIDLEVFHSRPSDFINKYNLSNKKIVLGVAMGWERRKGLDVFIELAQILDDEYKVVLVGTNETIDKQLPDKIISIHSTTNQVELAEIYSAANIFVNPTREDNYPTVNMEAIACGTPVVTFDTGGSAEMLGECGAVVPCDDVQQLRDKIIDLCGSNSIDANVCLEQAKSFDKKLFTHRYIQIYKQMIESSKKSDGTKNIMKKSIV